MTVLERLAALREPIGVHWDDEWSWVASLPVVDWRPRPLRFKGVMSSRIDAAMRGWTIRHLWRWSQGKLVRAIKMETTEIAWLKKAKR